MSREPTIFILSNMREFGGAERSIAVLIPHLLTLTRVRVFVENERHFVDLAAIGHPGLRLVRMPRGNGPLAMLGSLLKLAGWFWRERPRALLANGHKGALMLALLRPFTLGGKFAIYIRDFDYSFLPLILRRLPKALYLAPSRAVFEHPRYVEWGLPRHRCEVLENGVEAPKRNDALVAPPNGYVACCARLTPWKGVECLIEAFAEVVAGTPSAQLRIYGEEVDPTYAAELRALVTRLDLEEHVAFYPHASDMAAVYRGASVVVVPSLSTPPGPETFCRIIIEAWAHRKPAIAFAVGGPCHLINECLDGFLVPERDLSMLAARITQLLEDPALQTRMGERGWRKAQERFRPERIAATLVERLRECEVVPATRGEGAPVPCL